MASNIERDRCAIHALQRALRRLGPALAISDGKGNMRFDQRGQDIEYIRMTLDLYADVTDERGNPMIVPRQGG